MADHSLEDVREGKVGNHPIVGIAPETFKGGDRGPGEVAMGQHGGLGNAGRPRGVDQAGRVVRLQRLPATRQQARSPAPELVSLAHCLRPADDPAVPIGHVTLDQDDALQAGQLAPHREHLVEQFPVLHDQHLGFGVGQQVLDLLGRIGLIDGNGDQAGVEDGDVADLPLRPVDRPDGNPVLRVQPFGQ